MSEKTDVRRKRTRLMIMEAYLELLENTPKGTVTVQDVCARVPCSRKTFYTYFETRDLLHSAVIESLIASIGDAFVEKMVSDLSRVVLNSEIIRAFDRIRRHAHEFSAFFQRNDPVFLEKLNAYFRSPITRMKNHIPESVPEDLLVESTVSICENILRYFVYHPACSSVEITDYLYNLLSDSILEYLQIPKRKN